MAQDFSGFRPSRVWKRLSAARRLEAAELFWRDGQSTEQQVEAVTAIASHMKFRPKSVVSLPLDRKARYLSALPSAPETVTARALVAYHLERQRPMMAAFLDSLGIAHENGLISDETIAAPDAKKLHAAAADLTTKFPQEDVSVYFATLISQDPDTWGRLAEILNGEG
jgi:hypothetical protein